MEQWLMGDKGKSCQLVDLGRADVSATVAHAMASGACLWTHCVLLLQINRMDYVEINVDHKFHRHLIGKSGANSEWG